MFHMELEKSKIDAKNGCQQVSTKFLKYFCANNVNQQEISDKYFAAINIEKNTFHGEWNYVIKPQNIQA